VLMAIGNSEDRALAGEAERLIADASGLVRGAAIWALGRLDRNRLAEIAEMRRETETDPEVETEWVAALADFHPASDPRPP
jgi:epoxyqueuosine reductase